MTEETKALAIRQSDLSITEVMTVGDMLAKSGMFPDIKTQGQAVAKILAGRELGFGPVYSLTQIHVVQGKVMLGATVLAAKVKASGRYDYKVQALTDTKCALMFTDGGKEVYLSEYSIEDAKKGNLVKGGSGWERNPRAMLFARAISQGARIVCPHVIAGVYVPEDFGMEMDEDGRLKGEIVTFEGKATTAQEARTAPKPPGAAQTTGAGEKAAPAPLCDKCGKPCNLIPAGVSKGTGKPYHAFYACPDKCGGKPAKVEAKTVPADPADPDGLFAPRWAMSESHARQLVEALAANGQSPATYDALRAQNGAPPLATLGDTEAEVLIAAMLRHAAKKDVA